MSDAQFDPAKANFSTTDDLSDSDFSESGASHVLSDGSVVSIEAVNGQPAGPVVRDSAGKLLKSYNLSATDTFGARVCWVCFQPVDGPYTCVRAPCGSIVVEPM